MATSHRDAGQLEQTLCGMRPDRTNADLAALASQSDLPWPICSHVRNTRIELAQRLATTKSPGVAWMVINSSPYFRNVAGRFSRVEAKIMIGRTEGLSPLVPTICIAPFMSSGHAVATNSTLSAESPIATISGKIVHYWELQGAVEPKLAELESQFELQQQQLTLGTARMRAQYI